MDLFDLYAVSAHYRAGRADAAATAASTRVAETDISAESLRRDVERLYLIVEALWTIVRQTTNLTDDDLKNLVQSIDLRDGREDGSNADHTAPIPCGACGKMLMKGQTRCLYCGAELEDVFRHAGK